LVATAESGSAGIHELLRSGRAAELLRGSAAAEEAEQVEQLIRALGGGKRAAVGREEVDLATEGGALETVLVGEDGLSDPSVQSILDRARAAKARVLIVAADGEAGRRLAGLGGIAAILRYDWFPPHRVVRSPGGSPPGIGPG
ncbi:MAG: hypothetical protein ACRECR_04300, partial [Thermoplasmata archaeon]